MQYHPDRNPGDKAAEKKLKATGVWDTKLIQTNVPSMTDLAMQALVERARIWRR